MNTNFETFTKDPNATLDYAVDWSNWLQSGETISSVAWTVPTGLTKTTESSTTTAAVVWVSGGGAGMNYIVACKITTSAGRIDERSILIKVEQR